MLKTRRLIRTYCLAALAAAVGSAAAQLILGWLSIVVFRPEHPEVAAWRLWNDLFERLSWITALLTGLELVALICAFDLVARVRSRWVLAVAGSVPAMILGLMKVLPAFITFYTPLQSVGFVLLFIGMTFALLKGVLVLGRRHASGSGSG
jgi:uncharacterized membrane protein